MGCGKSTYGKKLAGKLKFSSVDLDTLVEEKAGKTVYEIFESEGEDAFRKLEAEALRETAELDNCVIATGGGAPAYWENMAWMNENGKAVFLKLFENKIFKRLANAKEPRPAIDGMDSSELKAFIHEKLTWRSQYYDTAEYVIQPEFFPPAKLAEIILEDLEAEK